MKKRKPRPRSEKPRMCDPGMCDCCQYIGEGDFICDKGPGQPVLVVEDWQPNENAGRCRSNASALLLPALRNFLKEGS